MTVPTERVGIGIKAFLFNERGKVLLLKRGPKYEQLAGLWDLAGGRQKPGERWVDALTREVEREELDGIRVLGQSLKLIDHVQILEKG